MQNILTPAPASVPPSPPAVTSSSHPPHDTPQSATGCSPKTSATPPPKKGPPQPPSLCRIVCPSPERTRPQTPKPLEPPSAPHDKASAPSRQTTPNRQPTETPCPSNSQPRSPPDPQSTPTSCDNDKTCRTPPSTSCESYLSLARGVCKQRRVSQKTHFKRKMQCTHRAPRANLPATITCALLVVMTRRCAGVLPEETFDEPSFPMLNRAFIGLATLESTTKSGYDTRRRAANVYMVSMKKRGNRVLASHITSF